MNKSIVYVEENLEIYKTEYIVHTTRNWAYYPMKNVWNSMKVVKVTDNDSLVYDDSCYNECCLMMFLFLHIS